MNSLIERLTGMHTLTDQVVAMDLLIAAKSGVRNYAMAVTEVATPEIKAILTKQLDEAIDLHERIADYLMQKGWYHPWDVKEQLRLDLRNAPAALDAPTL